MEEFEALNTAPMGSGPMKYVTFEVGQYVELVTNDDYFEGRPYIDGVIYKVVPAATAAAAVNAGDVDVAEVTANLENYDTMTEGGIAEVQEYLGNSYRYIGFNLRLEKFQDKRVRQALWYGLNLKDFIDAQWEGFAAPCLGPISPVSWAYPDTSELTSYDFDSAKAAALLEEAGWVDTDGDGVLDKDGEKFTIVWTSYNDVDWPLNLIAVAKENWGALGVELEGNLMEFTAVTDLVYDKQDFEMYNMGWSLAIDPDPTAIFGDDADVLGGFNAMGFHHARANEIFSLGRQEYDQAKRAELYAEWAKIANEEVPYIFVSIGTTINGVNNRVHNLELDTYDSISSQLLDIELDYLD
jgi:peptide/nickel transport system substrate-binding protein